MLYFYDVPTKITSGQKALSFLKPSELKLKFTKQIVGNEYFRRKEENINNHYLENVFQK